MISESSIGKYAIFINEGAPGWSVENPWIFEQAGMDELPSASRVLEFKYVPVDHEIHIV